MTKYSRKKAIGLTILAAALLMALALSLAVLLQQRNRSLPQADAAGAAVNDRIEIHNTGSEAVDLSGYGLTEGGCTLPEGTVIEMGEVLTIHAANDRIEIHNTGSEAADLSGYGLSDDLASAAKWTFPDGTVIEPGEQLTIQG